MASSRPNTTKKKTSRANAANASNTANAAAAEEPEAEPPTAPTTASPAATAPTSRTPPGGYNVRDYQNPDAGSDQALTKPSKAKAVAKKGGSRRRVCFHCGRASAKCRSCGQCHRAWYCNQDCQRKDWKRHKSACRAAVAAEARRATRAREATAAARAASGGGRPVNETCVICIGPVRAPVELPCGHAYCGACLTELRSKGVAQTCPLCRIELPPGVDGLWDLAWRSIKRVAGMVDRGEVAWALLPPAEQEEVDEAVAMLTEAAAQGHANAAYNLGFLLENVRKDFEGAEAAYRAAIAANSGHARAHAHLVSLRRSRRPCAGCGARGVVTRRCACSGKTRYCGAECQRSHWSAHKTLCLWRKWRRAHPDEEVEFAAFKAAARDEGRAGAAPRQ